jgi:hypothetical protein
MVNSSARAQPKAAPVVLEETTGSIVFGRIAPHVVVGAWADLPNFRCSHCGFATLESESAVEWHIAERHP